MARDISIDLVENIILEINIPYAVREELDGEKIFKIEQCLISSSHIKKFEEYVLYVAETMLIIHPIKDQYKKIETVFYDRIKNIEVKDNIITTIDNYNTSLYFKINKEGIAKKIADYIKNYLKRSKKTKSEKNEWIKQNSKKLLEEIKKRYDEEYTNNKKKNKYIEWVIKNTIKSKYFEKGLQVESFFNEQYNRWEIECEPLFDDFSAPIPHITVFKDKIEHVSLICLNKRKPMENNKK